MQQFNNLITFIIILVACLWLLINEVLQVEFIHRHGAETLVICHKNHCCSATVNSKRLEPASSHNLLTCCRAWPMHGVKIGQLSHLNEIRMRFLPVSSYIQTVKVKVLIVELDSGNSPIIPVRFLFYTTYTAARLQSNLPSC